MILTRCAFAVMISMSGKSSQLSELVEDFDMMIEDISIEEPKFSPLWQISYMKVMEDLPGSKDILEHWMNATKMRKWFAQAKLNIAEDVAKLYNEDD